ncbi:hypothetical protein EDI_260700 [Entamoeba dispar SAW760]|uniref:Uncharacterized protein n=1 Tax=Entamoeba dispar (strain ATCC PRA-260 / SAW760) TaxID=370354 RepID=B0EIZ1_ENTDS|nr:uncharacterized protein EDI_260700 [Entamoeba dispar SAW760]EDR25524.1 hypothetical protein EDI_260700 [Entamoeba dispar SAW760]|eukprot:EDR25524.1 hypothetical protein EDI_260700 [Entamoeba dispar SAW760]
MFLKHTKRNYYRSKIIKINMKKELKDTKQCGDEKLSMKKNIKKKQRNVGGVLRKEIYHNPIIQYQLEEINGIRNEECCQKVISERIKYIVELITIKCKL